MTRNRPTYPRHFRAFSVTDSGDVLLGEVFAHDYNEAFSVAAQTYRGVTYVVEG